ncbi:MAG: nicotinate-nucleotide adenylyltransferase [Aureliella sp.]
MGTTTDTVGQREADTLGQRQRKNLAAKRRIGLVGGSFDPVHLGHLLAAEQCREQLGLEEVRFILAATSPFKLDDRPADSKHRWEMLQIAISGNPFFRADDRELRRGGTSYTVDTLREFRAELPDAEIVFLMGADALADFAKWREPEEICRLAFVAVVPRGGHMAPDLGILRPFLPAEQAAELDRHLVRMPQCEISSTNLRQVVAEGRSLRYQVPAAVAAYIEQHGLYREPT